MAKIDFDLVGIGQLLRSGRLRVPPNQRSYKWEEEHITDLFQDLAKAIEGEDYFLGTIVLTDSTGASPEVTDGQQRLATTSILIAAIRDFYLHQKHLGLRSQFLQSSVLAVADISIRIIISGIDGGVALCCCKGPRFEAHALKLRNRSIRRRRCSAGPWSPRQNS